MAIRSDRQRKAVMARLRRRQGTPPRKTPRVPGGRPIIESVVIEVVPEEYPDTSHYGEYSNTWKPGAIDREEQGDWERGQFRYFIPSNLRGNTPADNLADYKRAESFNRGDWQMVGVRAKTTLLIPQPQGGFVTQTITSPGLWGIESDSGRDYFMEVGKEELGQLKHDLKALNVPEKAADEAIKKAELKED